MKAISLIAIILVFSLIALVVSRPTQETHPTTPGLTSAEANINLSIGEAVKRANEALKAAGLTLHKPMPQTIGASNEWVFAIINLDRKEDTTRVVATVASNPTKRGESYRVCMYLIEFMKTGKAPSDAPFKNYAGIWEWKWKNARSEGTTNVTLKADGTVSAEGANWGPTTWWSEEGKVFVYFPSAFPKTNLHYVVQFTVSSDGKSMSAGSSYYYSSVAATRIGDIPGSETTGGSSSGGATTSGTTTGTASDAGTVVNIGAPKLPPAPLPLPPLGANSGIKSEELLGDETPTEQQWEVQMRSIKAVHVPDRNDAAKYDGQMMVEVTLSDVGERYSAHIYVGGYLESPKDGSGGGAKREGVGGVSYDGHVPAYKFVTLGYETDRHSPKPGTLRRFAFDMPKVLPASVRVELYEITREGSLRFAGKMETMFDMPFEDRKVESGALLGKAGTKITGFAALLDGGADSVTLSVPFGQGRSSALRFGGRAPEGSREVRVAYDADLDGTERWKEAFISVGPVFRDRDHRNNRYWPNLPNGGYVDAPPVHLRL